MFENQPHLFVDVSLVVNRLGLTLEMGNCASTMKMIDRALDFNNGIESYTDHNEYVGTCVDVSTTRTSRIRGRYMEERASTRRIDDYIAYNQALDDVVDNSEFGLVKVSEELNCDQVEEELASLRLQLVQSQAALATFQRLGDENLTDGSRAGIESRTPYSVYSRFVQDGSVSRVEALLDEGLEDRQGVNEASYRSVGLHYRQLEPTHWRTRPTAIDNSALSVDALLENENEANHRRKSYAVKEIASADAVLDSGEAYGDVSQYKLERPLRSGHSRGFENGASAEGVVCGGSRRSVVSSQRSIEREVSLLPAPTSQHRTASRKGVQHQLAVNKYAPINTSTGSSTGTSGVDISSTSSELPPYAPTRQQLNRRKNVHIAPPNLHSFSYDEDVHDPAAASSFLAPLRTAGSVSDYEDDNEDGAGASGAVPADPLNIYRTPSFRHAIECGSSSKGASRAPLSACQSFDCPTSSSRGGCASSFDYLEPPPPISSAGRYDVVSLTSQRQDVTSHTSQRHDVTSLSSRHYDVTSLTSQHLSPSAALSEAVEDYFNRQLTSQQALVHHPYSKFSNFVPSSSAEEDSCTTGGNCSRYRDPSPAGGYRVSPPPGQTDVRGAQESRIDWRTSSLWDSISERAQPLSLGMVESAETAVESTILLDGVEWNKPVMESGSSPVQRRCLSTLTEEDMGAADWPISNDTGGIVSQRQHINRGLLNYPSPALHTSSSSPPILSSVKQTTSFVGRALNEERKPPAAQIGNGLAEQSVKQDQRLTDIGAVKAQMVAVMESDNTNCKKKYPSKRAVTTKATLDSNGALLSEPRETTPVSNVPTAVKLENDLRQKVTIPIDAAVDKPGAATVAGSKDEKMLLLGKAKRKSLHDMRYSSNNIVVEMSSDKLSAELSANSSFSVSTSIASIPSTATHSPCDALSGGATEDSGRRVDKCSAGGCKKEGNSNLNSCGLDDEDGCGDELYRTADPTMESIASFSVDYDCFPSLTDVMLRELGLTTDDRESTGAKPEEISFKETEEKFSALSLAFKTDRQTLDQRIEQHMRARDTAEANIQKELEGLKLSLKTLSQVCGSDQSSRELLADIQHHIEVLELSISRMSSRAELQGAVQQEMRVSHIVEVMLTHVEQLKKTYDSEHEELQAARKRDESSEASSESGGNRNVNSISPHLLNKVQGFRRRQSVTIVSNPMSPLMPLRINNPFVSLDSVSSEFVKGERVHKNSTAVVLSSVSSSSLVALLPSSLSSTTPSSPTPSIVTQTATVSTSAIRRIERKFTLRSSFTAILSRIVARIRANRGDIANAGSLSATNESRTGNDTSGGRPLEVKDSVGEREKTAYESDNDERERELLKIRREALRRSLSKRLSIKSGSDRPTSGLARLKASLALVITRTRAAFEGDTVPGLLLFGLVFTAIVLLLLVLRFSRLGSSAGIR